MLNQKMMSSLFKYLCKFKIIKHEMVIEAVGLHRRYLVCGRCDGGRVLLIGDNRR